MPKFIGEIPRTFVTLEAGTLEDAKIGLAEEAAKMAMTLGEVQEITEEALAKMGTGKSKPGCLLDKAKSCFVMGGDFAQAVGGSAVLGLGGGDIVMGSSLCDTIGFTEAERGAGDFISLNSFFDRKYARVAS